MIIFSLKEAKKPHHIKLHIKGCSTLEKKKAALQVKHLKQFKSDLFEWYTIKLLWNEFPVCEI